MPALSVIDLAMFMLETPERPFNIGPLVMLKPPKGLKTNFADTLVKKMLQRPMGTPWTFRYVQPPLGLPRLEPMADADPAPQVHRITLQAPGTQEQLFEKICSIHSKVLDRSKLLWELYVIDGVQGGNVVLYGKVHHGIIDGRSFVNAMSNWMSTKASDRTVRALWEADASPERKPRQRSSLGQKFSQALLGGMATAKTAAGLYRMLGHQAIASLGLAGGLPLPILHVPKAFQGEISSKRSFAYCKLSLAEMKAFGKAHKATVNDVLLTTLDMAMVRYLAELKQKSRKPLVADMPVALKGAKGGNQIAVIQFPLGTPGADPLQRLADICRETAQLKTVMARESTDTVMLYTTLVHGLPAVVEQLGFKRSLGLSNLLISNPFGVPEPRFLMGAEVDLVLPVSVIAPGQMLNVTAVTLGDAFQLGFIAVPNAVPHVEKLAEYTALAFEELKRSGAQASRNYSP